MLLQINDLWRAIKVLENESVGEISIKQNKLKMVFHKMMVVCHELNSIVNSIFNAKVNKSNENNI